jgi:quinol monooxygenase YgiN
MTSEEVVLLVSLVARDGKEAAAEAFLCALLEPTHREDGCLLYALHRSTEDPRRFAFVERWASRDLLERHLASQHIQRALEQVEELFTQGPDLAYYDAVPGGKAHKGSLAGHADHAYKEMYDAQP